MFLTRAGLIKHTKEKHKSGVDFNEISPSSKESSIKAWMNIYESEFAEIRFIELISGKSVGLEQWKRPKICRYCKLLCEDGKIYKIHMMSTHDVLLQCKRCGNCHEKLVMKRHKQEKCDDTSFILISNED